MSQAMFFTYHRVGRIPVLPAIAAAGPIVIVGGIAVSILAIVGIVGCGAWLLRALGLMGTERAPASQSDDIIDGVVVHRSSARILDP
jgi:hypothetical protein